MQFKKKIKTFEDFSQIIFIFKGTVVVILINPPFKEVHARFTTVPLLQPLFGR